jgi:nucleoside permease nupG
MVSNTTMLKTRLAVMSLLVFAVWGCYLISMGNFLSHIGLARNISWFYAVQCVLSLVTPAAVGLISDSRLGARRTLCLCGLSTALWFGLAALYALKAVVVEFLPLFTLYIFGAASFLPMIGVSNSLVFRNLRGAGLDVGKHFPTVRLCGTIGFIMGMLLVNFLGLQSSAYQFVLAAVIAVGASLYSLTVPEAMAAGSRGRERPAVWTEALGMFRKKETCIFFFFCILVGVDLQVTNSFGNVYISQFGSLPQFADTWGAANANAVIAVSQVSEAACFLLIPVCMRRFGIRPVMLIAILAWSLRFLFMGMGNTGSGLWMLIASGIVYGIAFDFFNIAGNVYVDSMAPVSIRAGAQGLFMAMSSGVGGTLGLIAAQGAVNALVFSQDNPQIRYEGWESFWYMFAAYALVTALLFAIWMKCSSGSGASKLQMKRSSSASGTI